MDNQKEVPTDNVKNDKVENGQKSKNTKKGKGKTDAIVLIIIVVIICAAVGGFVAVKNLTGNDEQVEEMEEKSTGSKWGDTYSAYIKDAISEEDDSVAQANYGINSQSKDAKVQFCSEKEEDSPSMVISYKSGNKSAVNVYQITEEEKVVHTTFESSKSNATLVYLYNVNTKEYSWYVRVEDENGINLYSLDDIKELLLQEKASIDSNNIKPSYEYKNSENTVQDKLDGTKIELSKFDQEFISVDVDEPNKKDLNMDMSVEDIKKMVTEIVSNYKVDKAMVTEEVKEEINTKVEELKTILSDIETAKEEIKQKEEEERKKAEEEAKKKAEEEAKKRAEEEAKKKAEAEQNANNSNGNKISKEKAYSIVVGEFSGCKVSSDSAVVKDSKGNTYYAYEVYADVGGGFQYGATAYVKTDGSGYYNGYHFPPGSLTNNQVISSEELGTWKGL